MDSTLSFCFTLNSAAIKNYITINYIFSCKELSKLSMSNFKSSLPYIPYSRKKVFVKDSMSCQMDCMSNGLLSNIYIYIYIYIYYTYI